MTDEVILKAAMDKARDGGFYENLRQTDAHIGKSMRCNPEIIFSHYFAKAFFGEEKHNEHIGDTIVKECTCGELVWHYYEDYENNDKRNCTIYCWQYNLQQMVLEEEPLKYLERFIK